MDSWYEVFTVYDYPCRSLDTLDYGCLYQDIQESQSPTSPSRVKLAIRTFTVERARALLEIALAEEDGLAVHRLLNAVLEEAGM